MGEMMRCGGVYEYNDPLGRKQQVLLVAVTQDQKGIRSGTFLVNGHPAKQIKEDSIDFQRMKLIGRPASPKMGRPRKE